MDLDFRAASKDGARFKPSTYITEDDVKDIISDNIPSSYITEDDVKDIISDTVPSSLTEDDVKDIISGIVPSSYITEDNVKDIISDTVPSTYITEDDVKDIISANVPSSYITEDNVKDIISGEISGINFGMPIGTIFPYISKTPPAGAYLLNGQTITNCSGSYPEFYDWFIKNKGELKDISIYKPWTQPALSGNGTMGGDTYGCTYSEDLFATQYATYYCYNSFNNNRSDNLYAVMTDDEILNEEKTMTFYSPVQLKVSQIELLTIDVNYYMQKFQIEASNDNKTWTTIVSGEITSSYVTKSAFCEIPEEFQTPADKTGWNYIRLNCISNPLPDKSIVAFPKVFITAEEYYYTGKISDGNIIVTDTTTYDAIFKKYGFCNAFAISGDCDVILPTWNGYQTPLGNSVPVKGNGMTLGLTDGTYYYGATSAGQPNGSWAVGTSVSNYGSALGAFGNVTDGSSLVLGVTKDTEKSGIIADISNYPKDNFYWCIQVFNVATELSTQNSDMLASQMQMKAQTNLANVTNPVQKFKTMAIDWSMPDYEAGVDITSNFSEKNGSYTVPYDCCIVGAGAGDYVCFLYTKSGCTCIDINSWSYTLLCVDGASDVASYIANHVYIPSGMTVYGDITYANTGKLIMYPLKGADKESTIIEI
ncbi:MAG: hypothetical protein IJ966_05105 [Bacilli bacterium]|nr:hypothetical protein [Bacilli bacterium]